MSLFCTDVKMPLVYEYRVITATIGKPEGRCSSLNITKQKKFKVFVRFQFSGASRVKVKAACSQKEQIIASVVFFHRWFSVHGSVCVVLIAILFLDFLFHISSVESWKFLKALLQYNLCVEP